MKPSKSSFQYFNEISAAAEHIKDRMGSASVGLVLGSGLAGFTKNFIASKTIPFSQIPGMPNTSVKGHSGNVVMGELNSESGQVVKVLCFSGRVHMYEGHSLSKLNFLARVAYLVGCKLFILTNSAGGCLNGMSPGSIMVIRDHMRFTCSNLMLDLCEDPQFGPRYLDTKGLYSEYLLNLARHCSQSLDIELHEGVYCWTPGPTYETPAEVRAGVKLGVGAFGMSTVPEALASSGIGMEVFAISLATNLAAGLMDEVLTHDDVTKVAREAGPRFEKLLLKIITAIDLKRLHRVENEALKFAPFENLKSRHQLLYSEQSEWARCHHILSDANVLKEANVDQPAPSAVIFIYSRDQILLPLLSKVRIIPLIDLPNFSRLAHTPSGLNGLAYLGTTFLGSRILVISSAGRVEGFSDSESFFLITISRIMGCSLVSTICDLLDSEKASANYIESTSNGKPILILNDFVDRNQCQLPVNMEEFLFLGLRDLKIPTFSFNNVEHVGSEKIPFIHGGSAIFFPGPALPSFAECSIAARVGIDGVGITSPAPLIAASAFGIPVFAIGMFVGRDMIPINNLHIKQAISLTLDVCNGLPTVALDDIVQNSTLDWIPRFPSQQEDYESVFSAAAYLKSNLLKGFASTFSGCIADFEFFEYISSLEIVKKLRLSDLPHSHRYISTILSEKWSIGVAVGSGQMLVVVYDDTGSPCHLPGTLKQTFMVRVLKTVGCDKVFLLSRACSIVRFFSISIFSHF